MARQACVTQYHEQHTLGVCRRRQVWVTPSPVSAETGGTDVIDCGRSLTSNCSNHSTAPHPILVFRTPLVRSLATLGCERTELSRAGLSCDHQGFRVDTYSKMSTVDVISWGMALRVLPIFFTLCLPLTPSFLLNLFSFCSLLSFFTRLLLCPLLYFL